MKNLIIIVTVLTFGVANLFLTGCKSTLNKMTTSASQKNIEAEGYLLLGKFETNNAETTTPKGEFITGRLKYKSRKVGIDADQKTPNTGSFSFTQTKSIFGTEETIIEYDYTAGNEEDAAKALKVLEAKQKEALELLQKQKSNEVKDE